MTTTTGLTTEYDRFSSYCKPFGIIASYDSCVRFTPINGNYKAIATSGGQYISIWDLKTRNQLATLNEHASQITYFSINTIHEPLIAVGHSDGVIKLFNYHYQELKVTFNGHKSRITTIEFDPKQMRLASGSFDTTIIIWDIVNERGLYKLKGHKNVVTKCLFMKNYDVLISSSKDGIVKFWDLSTQHCFKTFLAHRNEILDLIIFKCDTRLIIGADELKVWKIESKLNKIEQTNVENNENEEEFEDETSIFRVSYYGSILRSSVSRFSGFNIDPNERIIVCYGRDKCVEYFQIRTEDELSQHLKKLRRKMMKTSVKRDLAGNEIENDKEVIIEQNLNHEIEKKGHLQTSARVKFCDIICLNNWFKITLLLSNNSIENFSLDLISGASNKLNSIEYEGHRNDVKNLSFSYDNMYILSTSKESIKIWNRATQKCLTTIKKDIEEIVCSMFTPGCKECIVGTKTGKLQLFDLNSTDLIETFIASEEGLSIRSLCSYPNEKGLITGGEDKKIKFWEYEYTQSKKVNRRVLTLILSRTLTMSEEILCVKIAPNSRLVAIALLNCSVHLHYYDTLKFFLSLYGHKLPVVCMDISDDSKLIITGSSDKNIKIWGLDFGDCHRSIFAHELDITGLVFIPKSHLFFSCSKDRTIKQWNADKFHKITTLKGNQAEVWTISISPNGKYLASSGHDKTIRIWENTEDLLILEEEEQIEREEKYDTEIIRREDGIIAGEKNEEVELAVKSSKETIIGLERLMESIDICKEQVKALYGWKEMCKKAIEENKPRPDKPEVHVLMKARDCDDPYLYVLNTLTSIKSSELEKILLSLPFTSVIDILTVCIDWLEKNWQTELICRVICFLIRTHFGQLCSSQKLIAIMEKLRTLVFKRAKELKDILGINMSGLLFIRNELDANDELITFKNVWSKKRKHKKRKSTKNSALLLEKVVEDNAILLK